MNKFVLIPCVFCSLIILFFLVGVCASASDDESTMTFSDETVTDIDLSLSTTNAVVYTSDVVVETNDNDAELTSCFEVQDTTCAVENTEITTICNNTAETSVLDDSEKLDLIVNRLDLLYTLLLVTFVFGAVFAVCYLLYSSITKFIY